MSKPSNVECPDTVWNITLMCWDLNPEKRPTFEYIFAFFDDFFISAENSYRDVN